MSSCLGVIGFSWPGEGRRLIARSAVTLVIATILATLAWIWGLLSWKYVSNPSNALLVAGAVFGASALVYWRWTARLRPRSVLGAVGVPFLLGSCAATCTSLSDFNPGGGTNFMFANKMPANATDGFGIFMQGAFIIGVSAIALLLFMKRRWRDPATNALPEVLVASAVWLLLAAISTFFMGRLAQIELGTVLLPHLSVVAVLMTAGIVLAWRQRPSWFWPSIGVTSLVWSLALLTFLPWAIVPWFGPSRAERTAVRVCSETYPRFFVLKAKASPVTEYVAAELELERISCDTTFQYIDQKRDVVVGYDEAGNRYRGRELFRRVRGSAMERARAARDMLLAHECEEVLTGGKQVREPYERERKLVFSCVQEHYPHGPGTTVNMSYLTLSVEIDLDSLEIKLQRPAAG